MASLLIGDLTVAAARADDEVVDVIVEVTELSKASVRACLDREHGKTLVRNAFADHWPSLEDEVGDLTVAEARESDAKERIAQILGLSAATVARHMNDVHGKTKVRNLFSDYWPDDTEDDESSPESSELPENDDDPPSSVEATPDDYECEEGTAIVEDEAEDREYQAKALEELAAGFAQHKRIVLSLPTGAGKTFVAAKWLSDNLGAGGRALWLTHRAELVKQAEDELRRVFGPKRRITRWTSAEKDDSGDVVIATVACQNIPEGPFRVLVVDEAHHRAAPTYKEWAARYRFEFELGLTATPERLDERSLGYQHTVKRAFWDLVEQGYLAAPIHHVVNTNESYELRKDRIRDDFEEASLRQLDNPQRNGIVVQQYLARRADYGKTLVFAINVAHAENLVAEFRKTAPDVRVANILGTTDATARRRLVDDFEKGRLDVLVNCKVFVEGFNCKDIETVFLTRPTMSAVLYCQMVGRGTRVVGGKKTFHLVEFEDQLSKYADKLAGFWSLGESDREVIRAATERAKARPGDAPLLLPPGQAEQWSADLHVLGGVLAYWDARAFVQGATLVYRQELDAVARAVPAGGAIDRPGLAAAFMAGHWTSEEREFLSRSVRDDFVFHFYDFSRTDMAPPPTAPPAVAAIHSSARAVAPLSKSSHFWDRRSVSTGVRTRRSGVGSS